MSIVATQAYTYAGRSLKPGDAFDAAEKDANTLKLLGKATDPPAKPRALQTKVLEPAAPDAGQNAASPSTKPKRQYRRRDLVPET